MMPSLSRLYGRAGVELGQSGFGIKGFGYTQHYEWVEANLPGGLAAQDEALGVYREHPFFSQTFYAGTHYDVFPLVLLGHACASVSGVPMTRFVQHRSRSQAEQDLRYIRKWLVQLASPLQVARRLPSVATAYFNFGKPSSTTHDGGLDGLISGVPEALSTWLMPVIVGFASYALEVNGAKSVTVRATSGKSAKTHEGFALSDITTRFRWK